MVNMLKALLLFITLFPASYKADSDKRLLLIFADKASNPAIRQQNSYLKVDLEGIKDRDLEVRIYYGDRDAKRFQDKHITSNFTVILVGKDGGDKLRNNAPLTLKTLFNTIDAMTMRKDEVEQAGKVSVL
jgi:hypothetical protein